MFTTDIYVKPNDDHSTTVPVPVGAANWTVNVHCDNVLESNDSVISASWNVHGRYKNNLQIVSMSVLNPTSTAATLNNNLLLGQSAYVTCAITASVNGSSSLTITYVKSLQIVSENL